MLHTIARERNGEMVVFDLYDGDTLYYENIQEAEPPEGVSKQRWKFLQTAAFLQFVDAHISGFYKGKSWGKGKSYRAVLTKDEISEIIVAQYHYDRVSKKQIEKLRHQ